MTRGNDGRTATNTHGEFAEIPFPSQPNSRPMFRKLVISYRTAQDLPAPHAFQAEISLIPTPEGLQVDFSREYIERDLLEKQEIEAEGFSHDDDFSWSGHLPQIWLDELSQLLAQTHLLPLEPKQLHLVWESDQKIAGRPENEMEWLFFAEQMIQACLEAGGKELPMELVLGKLEKSNFFEKARLVWYFERKELMGQILKGPEKQFSQIDWEKSQKQLQKWIEQEAQHQDLFQLPAHKGLFWLLNGEVWLAYGGGQDLESIHWVEDQLGM